MFANSRRLAERLTASLNELYEEIVTGVPPEKFPAQMVGGSGITGARNVSHPPAETAGGARQAGSEMTPPLLARAHHGSVSQGAARRSSKTTSSRGRLRCVVATSSLELGIDMGAVDLVIQVESPPSVASGLQRIGRAGHQVGEISKGVLFPKHRADLLAHRGGERADAGPG